MKYILSLFVCLCLGSWQGYGQAHTIKGTVADTFNKEQLEYASISVLRAADSVLLGFTRSNPVGAFSA